MCNLEENVFNGIKRLPKKLLYKQEVYIPIIIKNDWDYNDDAYIAMYAKETVHFYSRDSFIVKVEGRNLADVLVKFIQATEDYLKTQKKED